MPLTGNHGFKCPSLCETDFIQITVTSKSISSCAMCLSFDIFLLFKEPVMVSFKCQLDVSRTDLESIIEEENSGRAGLH